MLSEFGFNIGLAFQIVDDILDLVADDSTLGKTSGIDIGQGRGVAVALGDGNGNGNSRPADPMEAIKRKMLEGDTIEKARQQADFLVHSAIASLDSLDNSPAKAELIALAQQVVERKH